MCENVLPEKRQTGEQMWKIEQHHQQRGNITENDIGFWYCPGEEVSVKIGYKREAEREEEEGHAPEQHLQQEQKNDQKDDKLHKGEGEDLVAAVCSDTEIHIQYKEESDKHDSDPLRDGQCGESG